LRGFQNVILNVSVMPLARQTINDSCNKPSATAIGNVTWTASANVNERALMVR
jgi:hypothetical protein